jgi:hypothetical protein
MAGGIILFTNESSLITAAILFYLKDIFDSADGQLARAKQMFSRRGRFYDSIGDYIVNVFLFTGLLSWMMRYGYSMHTAVLFSAAGFIGVNLRVSFHVYYQTAYLHRQNTYLNNRLTEEVRTGDELLDATTRTLQKIFLWMYGWQDRLVGWWDSRLVQGLDKQQMQQWYENRAVLFLNGWIGIGTEYVGLTLCLIFGSPVSYIFYTLGVLNSIWMMLLAFRYFLRRRLRRV